MYAAYTKGATQVVDIKRFDFASLPRTSLQIILGKRGTGKSSLCQYIAQCSTTCGTGVFVAMCGSETVKESWARSIHPIFIQDPSVEYLESFRDQRNQLVRTYRRRKEPIPDSEHCTLILDDVASIRRIMRSPVLAYLASNSRHLCTSIFVLAQYACQVPAEIRNQFDLIFMLATADTKTIRRMHAEYCSITDLRIFEKVLAASTGEHGVLVIDNRAVTDRIEQVCFYGKIDTYPFEIKRLGPPSAWAFGDMHYMDIDGGSVPTAAEAAEWERSLARDVDDDAEDSLSEHDSPFIRRDIRESRRVFEDRHGRVVVRRL